MDIELFRQKEVLRKLREDNIVDVSKQAFSKSVSAGHIPHIIEEDVKQKQYNYDAVIYCIKSAGLFGYNPDIDLNIEEEEEAKDIEELADIYDRFKKNPTLVDANIIKTIIATKRDQIKLDTEEGLMVKRVDVENTAFKLTRIVRDKMLSTPERISNQLASIDKAHDIKEFLYKEFMVILDGFSVEAFINEK